MFFSLAVVSVLASVAAGQFPPKPEGVTVRKSKFHEGVRISYKEPGICETTEGVKSYAGYVHLPPNTVNEPGEYQNYPINTFFWFFESRKDPHNAPLSIWLNGGAGASSSIGLFEENGPCFVGSDSNSTYLNPYSWNNEVNMLYIDQPVQAGFSYDTPTNVTINSAAHESLNFSGTMIKPADFSNGVPEQNNTFWVGTLASQNLTYTSNSTLHAAHALWHFAQTWFEEFPAYKPHDEKISLWTESYGGKYGPAFTSFFTQQNEKIANGTISGPGAHYIHMDTLGIINGCIDAKFQGRAYVEFAYNNTYGIKAINELQYTKSMYEIEKSGGLQDRIEKCQQMARDMDPDERGDLDEVNKYCSSVSTDSWNYTIGPYTTTKEHGWYDVTHPFADPFPAQYMSGFLNQHWVQAALGVPVNFTVASEAVSSAFDLTGDFVRGAMLDDIGYVLDSGIKVALMYGDRDYACNWIGGEASSLQINYSSATQFREAGYTPIEVTSFYSGGQVRQYANLSFSRVYQAGHMVPSYQPLTAYAIFMRALFNKDIATGILDLVDDYSTKGPSSTWHIKNDVLAAPEPECYVKEPGTCTSEQWEMVKNNTAKVKNWIVVGSENAEEERIRDGETAPPYFLNEGPQKILHGSQNLEGGH